MEDAADAGILFITSPKVQQTLALIATSSLFSLRSYFLLLFFIFFIFVLELLPVVPFSICSALVCNASLLISVNRFALRIL